MALNKLTSGPEVPLKCVDAALELGAACAARLVGLSYQGGGVEAARQGDKTISQLIMVVSYLDELAVVENPSLERPLRYFYSTWCEFKYSLKNIRALVSDSCRM